MKKIRRLLDAKAYQEKIKEEEDRLMNIGLKKQVLEEDDSDDPFGPVEIDIERMQASIDSGFTEIPDFETVEELHDWFVNRNV